MKEKSFDRFPYKKYFKFCFENEVLHFERYFFTKSLKYICKKILQNLPNKF